jgi:hypothetical protein
VAILGTSDVDPSQVDPNSVMLEGTVSPQLPVSKGAINDVAAPFTGSISNPPKATNCTTAGPDGKKDLNLKFDAKKVLEKLGTVANKDVRVLHLTGKLKPEYGGTAIKGEDVIIVSQVTSGKKKKRSRGYEDWGL